MANERGLFASRSSIPGRSSIPSRTSILTAPPMPMVMPDAKAAPLLSNLSVMSLELRATILATKKRVPEAKTLFEQPGTGGEEAPLS
jgi:hypothetical protein